MGNCIICCYVNEDNSNRKCQCESWGGGCCLSSVSNLFTIHQFRWRGTLFEQKSFSSCQRQPQNLINILSKKENLHFDERSVTCISPFTYISQSLWCSQTTSVKGLESKHLLSMFSWQQMLLLNGLTLSLLHESLIKTNVLLPVHNFMNWFW